MRETATRKASESPANAKGHAGPCPLKPLPGGCRNAGATASRFLRNSRGKRIPFPVSSAACSHPAPLGMLCVMSGFPKGLLMAFASFMFGASAAFAEPLSPVGESHLAKDVPSVVWTSRSGEAPFPEIRRMEFVDAGWLKWLLETHRFYCDVEIGMKEDYVLRIALPDNMELRTVSCHPEWAMRVRTSDEDFGWCRVKRGDQSAEISLRPCSCSCCRRLIRLRLGISERGWPFFGLFRN